MVPRKLTLHTDGGSRGNPGPMAIAGVAVDSEDGTELFRFKTFLNRVGTNNEAEYLALATGLGLITDPKAEVTCYLDSELVVKQLNGKYRINDESLRRLAGECLLHRVRLRQCIFKWIPRGDNELVDRLVNDAFREYLDQLR